MSYETNFYGEIISMDVLENSFSFEMLDIFVWPKNKLLKEDSFAASKLFANMEILKAAKGFRFCTMRDFNGHLSKNAVAKKEPFRLGISAYIGNYHLRVLCFDCELIQIRFLPTPIGIAQIADLKFEDALLKQEILTPAPPRTNWYDRRRIGITGIFPFFP